MHPQLPHPRDLVRQVRGLWLVYDLAAQANQAVRAQLQALRHRVEVGNGTLVTTEAQMDHCYRCTTCSKNWPRLSKFQHCIVCGSLCWSKAISSSDHVLTPREIERLEEKAAVETATRKAHEDFERYCEKLDADEQQADLARLTSDEPLYVEHLTG
jgi:flavoprotein